VCVVAGFLRGQLLTKDHRAEKRLSKQIASALRARELRIPWKSFAASGFGERDRSCKYYKKPRSGFGLFWIGGLTAVCYMELKAMLPCL